MPPPKGTPNALEGPGDYDVTATVHNDTYPAIDPTKSNFHGKSIFITGGSKGIGLAMSLAFAKAGASNIAVGARSDQSSVEKAIHDAAATAKRVPPRVLPITLDVTIQASVDNAAKEVEKAFGRLDILINNAGILGSIDRVADSDPDAWWNVWTVNFRGSYLVSRAFLPLLLKGGDKTIINVSSVGAHLTLPGASAYQTSKLAMVRFTEFLCADYGDQGVTAFAIHPGNVITDILGPDGPPDFLKHVMIETAELSADTVVYLTSEKRQWLGGRYINCTWDMPQLMAKEEEIVKGDKLKVRMVL